MKFLIWSMSHEAWWKVDARGYTTCRSEAGRYSLTQVSKCSLNRGEGEGPEGADVLVIDK